MRGSANGDRKERWKIEQEKFAQIRLAIKWATVHFDEIKWYWSESNAFRRIIVGATIEQSMSAPPVTF